MWQKATYHRSTMVAALGDVSRLSGCSVKLSGARSDAIVVLTVTPSDEMLEFYSGFVRLGYRVFIVIDDNNFKLDSAAVKSKFAGMSLIQFEDYECRRAGFRNFNSMIPKTCSAWEKSLYYFCCRDLSDGNVWFIEDDAFIPNHEIILAIDRKYEHADIISADNEVNKCGALDDEDGWPWWRLVPETILPPPWAHSMVCAVRLSRTMLTTLASFIRSNKNKLVFTNAVTDIVKVASLLSQRNLWRKKFFIEFIFHTLALHNQLSVVKAQELSGVVYRKEWDVSEMNAGTIYHPLKDRDLHSRYRKILNQNSSMDAAATIATFQTRK
jgi:hypothetical protein